MKRWNLVALILALVFVFALGTWYRPLVGNVRLAAAVDLALFAASFIGCRYALRRLTEGLDD